MTITVIVPLNEERVPQKGEYYWSILDGWSKSNGNFPEDTTSRWPIAQSCEIEVPDEYNFESIKIIGIYGTCDLGSTSFEIDEIELPRPKKKVKKWLWVVKCPTWVQPAVNSLHKTEDEIKRCFSDSEWYHKIPETEIETDE